MPRHTYTNLKETGYFTINHIHRNHIRQAHQTSAKYKEEDSEFEYCGFTPEYSEIIKAPYVKEMDIKIGLKYREEYLIKANDTRLIIGAIEQVIVPAGVINSDHSIDLVAAQSVTISGLETYLIPEKLAKFSYARPDRKLDEL